MPAELTKTEEELLSALEWLLRVSEGGAHDDDDLISAHNHALKMIEKYSPPEEDPYAEDNDASTTN